MLHGSSNDLPGFLVDSIVVPLRVHFGELVGHLNTRIYFRKEIYIKIICTMADKTSARGSMSFFVIILINLFSVG